MGKRRSAVVGAIALTLAFGVPGDGAAENRGTQFTPDGKRVLVNKDVGDERWAITLNDDGTATGNVFRADGGDPKFIFCRALGIPNTYECFGADACQSTPCEQTYAALGTVSLPPNFFAGPIAITMTVDAREPVQGFQIRVAYPTSKGSFTGSGADASCRTDGAGIFTKNDDDKGRLILSLVDIEGLSFPVVVRCAFAVDAAVTASDFMVVVEEVVQGNATGDPEVLTVGVAIPP